jgi:hypothetical protein
MVSAECELASIFRSVGNEFRRKATSRRQLVSRHRECGRHSGCGLEFGRSRRDEAGAVLEAIQGALTHTDKVTTPRYLRGRRTKKLSEIAEARNSKRAAENDGGTA